MGSWWRGACFGCSGYRSAMLQCVASEWCPGHRCVAICCSDSPITTNFDASGLSIRAERGQPGRHPAIADHQRRRLPDTDASQTAVLTTP
ncbi:hypothetical protein FM112_09845 [Gulosibacter sp. 10]|nr:hypothetical protein FM112_09845 [Gulosibacter sp. 10]